MRNKKHKNSSKFYLIKHVFLYRWRYVKRTLTLVVVQDGMESLLIPVEEIFFLLNIVVLFPFLGKKIRVAQQRVLEDNNNYDN